jgi:hypothetical protein
LVLHGPQNDLFFISYGNALALMPKQKFTSYFIHRAIDTQRGLESGFLLAATKQYGFANSIVLTVLIGFMLFFY